MDVENDSDAMPEFLPSDLHYDSEKEEKYSQFLMSIGFRLHRGLKLLMCVECEHVCIPDKICGHLKSHNISRKNVEALLKELVGYYGIHEGSDIPMPEPGGPAIEGIKVWPGFQCSECNYVALEAESLRRHTRSHDSNPKYTKCSAQTLFRPLPIRYFSVTVPEEPTKAEDIFQTFLQDIEPSLPKFDLGDPSTVREIPLLLKKTHWHLFLDLWLKNPEKRKELKALVQHVLKGEVWSKNVSEGVQRYMKTTRDQANGVDWVVMRNMMKQSR